MDGAASDPPLRAALSDTEAPAAARGGAEFLWDRPVDFLGDDRATGTPQLRPEHLPEALAGFVFDAAARMGADPAAVALAALVACASVAPDSWRVQPKVHDDTWTERPCLWGATVAPAGGMKTPILRLATAPVEKLEDQARARHAEAMRAWKAEAAAAKSDKAAPPPKPRQDRFVVESVTTEALSEVLRDDEEGARFRLPVGKVLCRQDELAEWLANFDRYNGGKGGSDRGVYLRLYGGGSHSVDRVGRGSFSASNWSACVVGGIQPEPIQAIAKNAADDGLLQRFLYIVAGQPAEGEDRVPDRAALARYEALFPVLANLRPQVLNPLDGSTVRVVLDAGAHRHREAISALVRAQRGMPDASTWLRSALDKWPATFARLALVLHLVEIADARARGAEPPHSGILTERTAGMAAALMRDVLLPHLLRAEALLFATAQTGHARWVAGFILSNPAIRQRQRVAVRDVQAAYGALRAPEQRRELGEVMAALEMMAWLRSEEPKRGSREVVAWQVNPRIYVLFADAAEAERKRRLAAQAAMGEAIRRSIEGRR